jgi:hypothetical protein
VGARARARADLRLRRAGLAQTLLLSREKRWFHRIREAAHLRAPVIPIRQRRRADRHGHLHRLALRRYRPSRPGIILAGLCSMHHFLQQRAKLVELLGLLCFQHLEIIISICLLTSKLFII